MSRKQYIREAKRHLQNTNNYQKLDGDPTEHYLQEVRDFLQDMTVRKTINSTTMDALLPAKARVLHFYILPKIHKPGNSGRPIVSSCESSTKGVSKFVDYHLNPLVRKIPSHIKDTTDFFIKPQNLKDLPTDTLLVTLDVTALYTDIPHNEGIKACRAALNSRDVLEPPTEDLIHLIRLVLGRNNFTFKDKHYLQIHGTAMGTQIAPSYANIFMSRVEDEILEMVDKNLQYGGGT